MKKKIMNLLKNKHKQRQLQIITLLEKLHVKIDSLDERLFNMGKSVSTNNNLIIDNMQRSLEQLQALGKFIEVMMKNNREFGENVKKTVNTINHNTNVLNKQLKKK